MSKIENAFKNGKAFIPFITGGDPDIETTEKLIYALDESGADLIELGIPFSDPIAEGPVIEKADIRALNGGCTIDKLFEMLGNVRKKTDIPIVFLSYLNPVYNYGEEKFLKRCKECGVDGVIIPDLPYEERDELIGACNNFDVDLISMIAPTSEERISMIAKDATGFLYCVSSLGVTGMRDNINIEMNEMIKKVRAVSDIKCAVGFGISTPEQASAMAKIADGVIVGSAIVNIIAEHGKNSEIYVSEYVKSMKDAIYSRLT